MQIPANGDIIFRETMLIQTEPTIGATPRIKPGTASNKIQAIARSLASWAAVAGDESSRSARCRSPSRQDSGSISRSSSR